MQRRWGRRISPKALLVTLASTAMAVTAIAVSQAGLPPQRAVSVAMLSGGEAASLPGADMALPAPAPATEAAPASPPATAEPTTTTLGRVGRAPTVTKAAAPPPCPKTSSPKRPCPPPCPQPGSANSAGACPPPCEPAPPATTDAETGRACPPPPCGETTDPAQPSKPCPPPCRQYDPATGTSTACPEPCYQYEASGGSGSTCPPPCPQDDSADGQPAPCPPPCSESPESGGSCPPPCSSTEPAPASNTADPVPPSPSCPPPCSGPEACPPPCPSAAPTDEPCTPPCSYEPASGGTADGAFAPCPAPSGVTGRVTAGPTCPVERPDEPCPDKPVETTLRLLRQDGSVAATGKSGLDGTFRIAVAPGAYQLVADWPSRVGGCPPVDVTVGPNRFTSADVSCDTGIR